MGKGHCQDSIAETRLVSESANLTLRFRVAYWYFVQMTVVEVEISSDAMSCLSASPNEPRAFAIMDFWESFFPRHEPDLYVLP